MDAAGCERLTADEWYQDGQRLRSSGRYAEAISAFSPAIERNRLFADAYFSRGACHYALHHYQQAREDLNAGRGHRGVGADHLAAQEFKIECAVHAGLPMSLSWDERPDGRVGLRDSCSASL